VALQSSTPYGSTFYRCFLSELDNYGHPNYPEPPWFSALRQADREAAACFVHERRPVGKQLYQLDYVAPREPEYLRCAEIKMSCNLWLARRGISDGNYQRGSLVP
jgi:hypothetical protein